MFYTLKLEASNSKNSSTSMSRGRMRATNMTMDRLAQVLSRQMDFPVVNHTGLNGAFDFQLEWTPEGTKPDDATDAPPSIFTAIQEQLGLVLRFGTSPIEVLVIDHLEHPILD